MKEHNIPSLVQQPKVNRSNPYRKYCKNIANTVKPLTFACPLFREFHDLNKTVKLKGVNIDTIPSLTGITCVL